MSPIARCSHVAEVVVMLNYQQNCLLPVNKFHPCGCTALVLTRNTLLC